QPQPPVAVTTSSGEQWHTGRSVSCAASITTPTRGRSSTSTSSTDPAPCSPSTRILWLEVRTGHVDFSRCFLDLAEQGCGLHVSAQVGPHGDPYPSPSGRAPSRYRLLDRDRGLRIHQLVRPPNPRSPSSLDTPSGELQRIEIPGIDRRL